MPLTFRGRGAGREGRVVVRLRLRRPVPPPVPELFAEVVPEDLGVVGDPVVAENLGLIGWPPEPPDAA